MKTFLTAISLAMSPATFLAAGLSMLSAPDARAESCGEISIAEMSWASAGIAAHVDKFILEKGYGCTVRIVTGDTMPTFASMNEAGQPDMAPEIWVTSLQAPLNAALKDGRLIETAKILTDGGIEGWWIPKFISDAHPDIRTAQDALKHPDLFPSPDDPSKGAVYNCPSEWNCQIPTANLYRALKGDEAGFRLIDSGSAEGLDASIAKAFETKTGWLGYYWAPTAILGKYEMTKLSFGVGYDRAEWSACTAVPDCANPQVNGYPTTDVYTIVTKGFSEKAAVAMEYVKKRQWNNATVNSLLAWMNANRGTNEDAARYFLQTFEPIWTAWLAPDVAARVKAAL